MVPLKTGLRVVDDLSFSPNGTLLIYWGSDKPKAAGGPLYTQTLDGAAPVQLTGDEPNDADPDFSGDGARIAFRRMVPGAGGSRAQIAVVSTDGSGR